MPEAHTPDAPLEGELDVEARVQMIEPEFAVKGLFFEKLRERVPDDWGTLREALEQPPRLGRYVPFNNYPLADYIRIVRAVAQRHYGDVSLREGFRRTARDDFTLFSRTTFGKVALAAVGNARTAMIQMGAIYTKMAPGDWDVRVDEIDERTLRATWTNFPGIWEYQLGQTEGLCSSFGRSTAITVTERSPRNIEFEIVVL